MSLTPGTHSVGPDNGKLQVQTYRDGVAQKVGHDLIIDVGKWAATVQVGEGGQPAAVSLEADPRSLVVREGRRGLKPLTDKDRATIVKDIDAKILRGQPIKFVSSAVQLTGERLTVSGDLALGGATKPASFELALAQDGTVGATMSVTQSEWGIKPYRGLMGALKVRDAVEIVLDARLPGA
jgi:polyisoprenoid-binding protein YceI